MNDHAGEGVTLSNIGGVYHDQGQYIQALDYLSQALAIQQEMGNHAGAGTTLNNMGVVHHDQGQ
jgi:tetratricopeptide (TPR) repeat protein